MINSFIIWNLKINGKVVLKPHGINNGVIKMYHLLKKDGSFFNYDEFVKKYHIRFYQIVFCYIRQSFILETY